MLSYWKTAQDENLNMYSVDMIRVNLEMREDEVNDILKYFHSVVRMDIMEYPPCFQDFKYKNMFTITYEKGSTMTVGLCFNGTAKGENLKGFIEVNPNKCFIKPQCLVDVYYTLSRCIGWEITRWDLAIDIPTDRMSVVLGKDQRKYELVCKSKEDRTEYLGCRNNVGRVKVYNKTAESNLDYTVTRLEITMPNYSDLNFFMQLNAFIPEVWIAGTNTGLELSGLSDMQAMLVEFIRKEENPTLYLKRLKWEQRKKLEPYVLDGYKRLKVDSSCIEYIITELKDFFNQEFVFANWNYYRHVADESIFDMSE